MSTDQEQADCILPTILTCNAQEQCLVKGNGPRVRPFTNYANCLINNRADLTNRILNLWVNGMLTKWVDSTTKIAKIAKIAKCKKIERSQSSKGSAMSLKTLSSAFLTLAVGLGISLVAIVMEITCRFYGRNRKITKTTPIPEIIAPTGETTNSRNFQIEAILNID